MIRLVAVLATVVFIFSGVIYVQLLRADLVAVQGEVERADQALMVKGAELDRLRAERDSESAARVEYLEKLKVASGEIESLRNSLAAGDRRLHVSAVCPAGVPEAESARGVAPAAAVLSPDAERAYLRLLSRIKEYEAWLGLCRSTLLSWGYVD